MNIAIIGSGVFGISLAISLKHNKNNNIIIWTESEESLKLLEHNRNNYKPLNKDIDKTIKFSTSYSEVLNNCDLVLIAVAARYMENVTKEMSKYLDKKTFLVICSKGIKDDTCLFMHQIVNKYVPLSRIGIMSGGTFAIDVAHNDPVGITLACKDEKLSLVLKDAFNNTNIKIKNSKDIIGVELCGSIKNIIAILAGILEGLGYSESTRAFLLTESLYYIKKLIKELGGEEETILSYAGIGDLILTATSSKSRNYTYGILIGKKMNKEADDFYNNNTVEGKYTLNSINRLLTKHNIKNDLIALTIDILENKKTPEILVKFLMS